MKVTFAKEDESKVLEDLNIVQGSKIHLQDVRYCSQAKLTKPEIDWVKMTTSGSTEQIDSSSDQSMVQIDIMLMRFIEHHQLFEFIEVFKVYLQGDHGKDTLDSLGGKTFLHLAMEHNAD